MLSGSNVAESKRVCLQMQVWRLGQKERKRRKKEPLLTRAVLRVTLGKKQNEKSTPNVGGEPTTFR